MAAHYARNAYLQAKVQPETDPKRLILMLYEGALKHLRLAREGIEEKNACKRGENLSRAVAIISTLNTSLDSTITDEPLTFFRGLYHTMLIELGKVAVTHDVITLERAFRYLERLQEIWIQDVMGLSAQQASTAEAQSEGPTTARPTAPALVGPHFAYGPSPRAGQRTFSV